MPKKANKPVPSGYHNVTPYLIVKGGTKALEWYKTVFGAEEKMRMPGPDGTIGHAEIRVGDSTLMLADEFPQMGAKSPQTLGGSPVGLMLYVEDCDKVVERAVKNGAKIDRPVQNQFYGDRSGTIFDPFGHQWTIGTHIEDLTPEEMQQRSAEYMAKQAKG